MDAVFLYGYEVRIIHQIAFVIQHLRVDVRIAHIAHQIRASIAYGSRLVPVFLTDGILFRERSGSTGNIGIL